MFVSSGSVGPKSRPKGVDEGHQVNIPELGLLRYHLRRDALEKIIRTSVVPVKCFLGLGQVNPPGSHLERHVRSLGNQGEVVGFWCQEKLRREWQFKPYRNPTQVGGVKILRRASEFSLRN